MQEAQSHVEPPGCLEVVSPFSLSLLPPDAAGLGLGAALLAHTQVHRTLPPHPQSNPILLGQMTAGGGAREP